MWYIEEKKVLGCLLIRRVCTGEGRDGGGWWWNLHSRSIYDVWNIFWKWKVPVEYFITKKWSDKWSWSICMFIVKLNETVYYHIESVSTCEHRGCSGTELSRRATRPTNTGIIPTCLLIIMTHLYMSTWAKYVEK